MLLITLRQRVGNGLRDDVIKAYFTTNKRFLLVFGRAKAQLLFI